MQYIFTEEEYERLRADNIKIGRKQVMQEFGLLNEVLKQFTRVIVKSTSNGEIANFIIEIDHVAQIRIHNAYRQFMKLDKAEYKIKKWTNKKND